MNRTGPALLHMLEQSESEIRRVRQRHSADRREIFLISTASLLLLTAYGYLAFAGTGAVVIAAFGVVLVPLVIRAVFLHGRVQSLRREYSAIASLLGSIRIAIDDTRFSETDLQQIAKLYEAIDAT